MTQGDDVPPTPPDDINFYQLLGVEEDANEREIEKAYRNLVKDYHPDVSDHPDADEIFSRIQQAYEVLTDPRARRTYNQLGHEKYLKEVGSHPKKRDADPTSHEERVKSQAKNRSWNGDQTRGGKHAQTMSGQSSNTDANTSSVSGRTRDRRDNLDEIQEESDTSIEAIYETVYYLVSYPFALVEKRLSDDVISHAIRRTWATRTTLTFAATLLLTVVGELANQIGEMDLVLPTLSSFTTSPAEGFTVFATVLIVISIADQMKTDREVSRGNINAREPEGWAHRTVEANAIAATAYLIAVTDGANPVTGLVDLFSEGTLPSHIWIDSTNLGVLNPIISTVLLLSLLITMGIGLFIGFPSLTRLLWYDRYSRGYYVVPVIWELGFILPVLAAVWMAIFQIDVLPLPSIIGATLTGIFGMTGATKLGFTVTSAEFTAILSLALIIPGVVGTFAFLRRSIEIRLRSKYKD